jgi:hypothetical protein
MKATCYYCGALFLHSASAKGDHYPIPFRHGGTVTVPCCAACHDMKDRIPFGEWHHEAYEEIDNQWHLFGRYTKLFLAKVLMMMLDTKEVKK